MGEGKGYGRVLLGELPSPFFKTDRTVDPLNDLLGILRLLEDIF